MALIQVNLFSQALMRTVPVNVILPADKRLPAGQPAREEKPFPTLYLLHGIFGSYIDWVSGTRIQRYADEHDLAVVMPSGDNSFYTDQPDGYNFYNDYIGRELVELTRRMFPLSRRREDTFIGGLSMGGYGAMHCALSHPDTFGCIISLSGALHLEKMAASVESDFILGDRRYIAHCFGDPAVLVGSEHDPLAQAAWLKADDRPLPRIYMACGKDDGLLDANVASVRYLQDIGLDVTFEIGPGAHEWDFWDTYIKKAIEWLPLEAAGMGVSSGNVVR